MAVAVAVTVAVTIAVAVAAGFFVNISSFLLVKRTSSITLKLITMARNGGLVLVSAVVFGEAISPLEGVGYVVGSRSKSTCASTSPSGRRDSRQAHAQLH